MQSETRHITGRVKKRQVEELDKISEEENIDRSSALRKVLDIGLAEYLKRKAVEEYRKGKVSIGRASRRLDCQLRRYTKYLRRKTSQ